MNSKKWTIIVLLFPLAGVVMLWVALLNRPRTLSRTEVVVPSRPYTSPTPSPSPAPTVPTPVPTPIKKALPSPVAIAPSPSPTPIEEVEPEESPDPGLDEEFDYDGDPPYEDNCDPSYPDFCLPLGSADLDCGEVDFTEFTVFQPDPHGFDRDKDGVGCEG